MRRLDVLLDGFQSEEQIVPTAKLRLDGEFLFCQVFPNGVQAGRVVLEKDAECSLVISA